MPAIFDPLRLSTGQVLQNRLMLAPLTTQQSHADGRVSREDREWLAMRATGGFGLVASAAAAITREAQAFPGQYGVYSDDFVDGLSALATAIQRHRSIGMVQLQHGGARSLAPGAVGFPAAASAIEYARGLSVAELADVAVAFADGADRCVRSGFEAVQVHAAYGFLLAQFLDPESNRRSDLYGGSLDNRARLLREVLEAIRRRVPKAMLSVRLNFRDRGLRPSEMLALASELLADGAVDHVDFAIETRIASDAGFAGWLPIFSRRRGVVSVTGGFGTAAAVERALDAGADLVGIGTAAILHPDFPRQLLADRTFRPHPLPVPAAYLGARGVSPAFLTYLRGLPGFVEADRAAA